MQFEIMSFCRMSTKSDLLGFIDAGGNYRTTPFRRAFETGKVFCGDEFDAGNENVNVVINSALSNELCAFPDKTPARHKDFLPVVCMNTFGFGGSRTYVGRNQLDAATMDRFITISWDVDEALEAKLLGIDKKQQELKLNSRPVKTAEAWLDTVLKYRNGVKKSGVRHIISPRASLYGVKLIKLGVGASILEDALIFKGIDKEQENRIRKAA